MTRRHYNAHRRPASSWVPALDHAQTGNRSAPRDSDRPGRRAPRQECRPVPRRRGRDSHDQRGEPPWVRRAAQAVHPAHAAHRLVRDVQRVALRHRLRRRDDGHRHRRRRRTTGCCRSRPRASARSATASRSRPSSSTPRSAAFRPGIITNDAVTGATPAALYAKANDRAMTAVIFQQAFTPRFGDGVDVLIGAGRPAIAKAMAAAGVDLAEWATQRGRPLLASALTSRPGRRVRSCCTTPPSSTSRRPWRPPSGCCRRTARATS